MLKCTDNDHVGDYHDGYIEYSLTQFTDHAKTKEETLTAQIKFDLKVDGFCKVETTSLQVTIDSPVEYTVGGDSFSFGDFSLTQSPDCGYTYSGELFGGP